MRSAAVLLLKRSSGGTRRAVPSTRSSARREPLPVERRLRHPGLRTGGTERATGLGLRRDPGQTLEEYRRTVTGTGYLSDGHLDRLTRLATSAAYSQHEPDATQAEEAGDAADVAIREIRRAVGPARWFAGLYRRR